MRHPQRAVRAKRFADDRPRRPRDPQGAHPLRATHRPARRGRREHARCAEPPPDPDQLPRPGDEHDRQSRLSVLHPGGPLMPLKDAFPVLDDRRYDDIVAEIRTRIPRYTPEWRPGWSDLNDNDPGIILAQTFAWLADMLLFR